MCHLYHATQPLRLPDIYYWHCVGCSSDRPCHLRDALASHQERCRTCYRLRLSSDKERSQRRILCGTVTAREAPIVTRLPGSRVHQKAGIVDCRGRRLREGNTAYLVSEYDLSLSQIDTITTLKNVPRPLETRAVDEGTVHAVEISNHITIHFLGDLSVDSRYTIHRSYLLIRLRSWMPQEDKSGGPDGPLKDTVFLVLRSARAADCRPLGDLTGCVSPINPDSTHDVATHLPKPIVASPFLCDNRYRTVHRTVSFLSGIRKQTVR